MRRSKRGESTSTRSTRTWPPGSAIKWKVDSRGRVQIEAKYETKRRLGGVSPDYADAAVMGGRPARAPSTARPHGPPRRAALDEVLVTYVFDSGTDHTTGHQQPSSDSTSTSSAATRRLR